MSRYTANAVKGPAILAAVLIFSGCLVPQPLGNGSEQTIREPRTGAEYLLYLPEAYVKNNGIHPRNPGRRWPMVVTFHGMKPYDTWDRQIHEWQEQADAYGFIVVAPWLQTSDSFMEFPLRKEHSYVLRDKEAVMAILDHVLATTRADPNAVLSTSWSSGGFMAHYFPNRFPHRFTCIATRLSNFSPYILTDATVPLYRNTPVAVFIGDSDFPACTVQSKEAVAWYQSRGFRNVDAKMIDSMNHQRIPQTAAAFFARTHGIEPIDPETATRTLAAIRMRDWEPDAAMLARLAPTAAGQSFVMASRDIASAIRPVERISSRTLQPPDDRSRRRQYAMSDQSWRPNTAGRGYQTTRSLPLYTAGRRPAASPKKSRNSGAADSGAGMSGRKPSKRATASPLPPPPTRSA
ncbi:MAG: hypothetical protein V3T70_08795, partial [Phycisphaerae bacterium]